MPSGKSSHPITGASIAKYFGFPSVLNNTTLYQKSELDKVCYEINRGWNTEGSVIILLDETANVVDFVKVKAWWYVLLRAIREKIRSIRNMPVAQVYPRIQKRLQEIQRDMEVDSKYIKLFSKLGIAYAEWIYNNYLKGGDNAGYVIEKYPILWSQFLVERDLPLDSSLLDSPLLNIEAPMIIDHNGSDLPLLLLPQGIPGIGKSLLSQAICDQLNSEGIESIQVAQDDFVSNSNPGKACFDHVSNLLKSKKYKLVILARNNANTQQYSRYLQLESSNLCKMAFITPKELQTRQNEVILMCAASVVHRKLNNEDHPTTKMAVNDLASLPLKFMGEFRAAHSAFAFNVMTDDPIEVPPSLPSILSRFEQKGFRANDLTLDEIKQLKLDDKEAVGKIMKSHRPVNDMVMECVHYAKEMLLGFVPTVASYYCCSLSKLKSEEILRWVNSIYPIPKSWQIHANHVTLIHANDYAKNRDFWMKVSQSEGKLLTIVPLKVLYVPDNSCVLSVSLQDEDGNSADDLVISKVPHITIATAPKIKSFMSADTLVRFGGDKDFTTDAEIPPFKTAVMLHNMNTEKKEENIIENNGDDH